MTLMRKCIIIALCFSIVAITIAAFTIAWFESYERRLRPVLILILPLDRCKDLTFNYCGYSVGIEVEKKCREAGIDARIADVEHHPIFAVRASKVVRFVPDSIFSDDGHMEFEAADSGMVYIYTYDRYYRKLVEGP